MKVQLQLLLSYPPKYSSRVVLIHHYVLNVFQKWIKTKSPIISSSLINTKNLVFLRIFNFLLFGVSFDTNKELEALLKLELNNSKFEIVIVWFKTSTSACVKLTNWDVDNINELFCWYRRLKGSALRKPDHPTVPTCSACNTVIRY